MPTFRSIFQILYLS